MAQFCIYFQFTTYLHLFCVHRFRFSEHREEIMHDRWPNHVKHPYDVSPIQFNDGFKEPHTAYDGVEELHKSSDAEYYIDKSNPKYENYMMSHPIWTQEEVDNVAITHKEPERKVDKVAYFIVKCMRFGWDLSTGYTIAQLPGFRRVFKFTTNMVLLRIVFLETVAGVPGMMFGMVRHLNSLRRLERDRGWINTLLSEAENERMHLLV